MRELHITSQRRSEFIDITDNIQTLVRDEHIQDGYVIVYVPHTTAGITINEGADPNVQHDLLTTLERLVPENGRYTHAEGNSDAHIKASLLGSSITVLVKNNKLMLGTWQHIFFYEGDGPRKRTVYIDFYSH
jgi:secondary thiamine-phosphate synthase enzyme